ncbi:MAG TPA: hypothetical protein VLS90_01915 [Thermodesulfobacteriota bacterium]|nr:hypothetical protein [Thermodesulfobacteriota bacterium]
MHGLARLRARLTAAIGTAVLLVSFLFSSGMAGAQSCDCGDIDTIKQRIEEVQLAIATYTAQMVLTIVGNATMPADKVGYTQDWRDRVQDKVQNAMNNNMKGRKSTGAKGDTDSACNVTNNAKTPCMRESVRRHEEVHRQECLKTRNILQTMVTGEDRFQRDQASMGDFIKEEIKAYQTELEFLKNELERLEKKCKDPKKTPVLSRYATEGEKMAGKEKIEKAGERVSVYAESIK